MPTATATQKATATPAKKRPNNYVNERLSIRWHRDILSRLDLAAALTQWAEKQGHLVTVREGKSGTSVRIGGSVRPGASLMTKETRERIRAAGLTAEEIAAAIDAAAAAKASAHPVENTAA